MEENSRRCSIGDSRIAGVWAQSFLQENKLAVQAMDRRPDGILEDLEFAPTYVSANAKERHGGSQVGADAWTPPCADVARDRTLSGQEGKLDWRARKKGRAGQRVSTRNPNSQNDLWRTVPTGPARARDDEASENAAAGAGAAQEICCNPGKKSAPSLSARHFPFRIGASFFFAPFVVSMLRQALAAWNCCASVRHNRNRISIPAEPDQGS